MKIIKIIIFPIICIAIIVLFTYLACKSLFAEIAVEQMLWHLKNTKLMVGAHTDKIKIFRYLITIIIYISLCSFLFLCDKKIASFIYAHIKKFSKSVSSNLILHSLYLCEIGIGLAAFLYIAHFTPEIIHICKEEFFPQALEDNTFIADNIDYSAQSGLSFPNGKNNLVCIMVESMEDSFEGYIPELDKLRKQGFSLKNKLSPVHGTTWTIAAQTAWHFGLPLKPPKGINKNHYISRKGFLPKAVSIFDLLSQNGYKCVLVMGSDAYYSGTEILFSRHGQFDIYDKKYFQANGYDMAQNQGIEFWGANDRFVLDRAFQIYNDLLLQNKPFVLFVVTIDTHAPDGFALPEDRKFNDIRDAILATDRNISNFVKKILEIREKREKLALCVIGDHALMADPDFLKNSGQRHIYNFFTGNLPAVPKIKQTAPFSTLDLAPTLLHMTGAQWATNRFGLGSSIFSNTPALIETIGKKNLDEFLSKHSTRYEEFY